MAKKAMIVKQQRGSKFKVREYTRCERCGRPHSVYRKFNGVKDFISTLESLKGSSKNQLASIS